MASPTRRYGARQAILKELRREKGRLVDARWLQKPRSIGTTQYWVHPLIRGIHKPKGEPLVASIYMALDSPYRDEIVRQGKAWCVVYHRQAGPQRQWDNAAMAATVGKEIGVIQQICPSPKPSYLVLGVGRLLAVDAAHGLALIASSTFQVAPSDESSE